MSVLAADLSQSLSSSKRELETDSTVKTGHTSGSGYVSTIWYGQEGNEFLVDHMDATEGSYSSVQFSRSVVSDSLRPHAHQTSLSITNSWSRPKPMSIESVMPSNHLILCRPLLLPSIFPSIRVFSNESALHIRWPKYWSFSYNISPSNEHPGPIFRMDWLDLLAVQGTLKSLLQHHRSKASILRCSAFFIVQLTLYMTTGKTIALTRWTFVDKVMSLLSNMLSRLVITFLPRSKCFFNFMAAITICSDFGAPENKVSHCFHCFPIYLPRSDGTGCHDLSLQLYLFVASYIRELLLARQRDCNGKKLWVRWIVLGAGEVGWWKWRSKIQVTSFNELFFIKVHPDLGQSFHVLSIVIITTI